MTSQLSAALAASRLTRQAAVAIADVDPDKAQLLHALSQDIFEQYGTPDLILPKLNDGYDLVAPTGALLFLDAKGYQLVNWKDYRGWEVRRARKTAEGPEFGNPHILGYISTLVADSNNEGNDSYTIRDANGMGELRGFKRLDAALRKLASWS